MAFYGGKLNHVWVDLFITDRLPKSKAGMCFTRLLQRRSTAWPWGTGTAWILKNTARSTSSLWAFWPRWENLCP